MQIDMLDMNRPLRFLRQQQLERFLQVVLVRRQQLAHFLQLVQVQQQQMERFEQRVPKLMGQL